MRNSGSLLAAARALAGAGMVLVSVGCGGAGSSGDGAGNEPDGGGQGGQGEDGGTVAPGLNDAGSNPGTPRDASAGTTDGGASPPLDSGASVPPRDGGTPSVDAGQPTDSGSPDSATKSSGRVVGGYYPNWTPSPVRIRDIDPHYNVVYLFAATPVGGTPGTTGAVEWAPPGDGLGAATNLNADIAYARASQGRKIILSVGGAGNAITFPARAKSQAFVDSVVALNAQLGGIDGIDWDSYEGSDSPDTSEMIWISLHLKSKLPGFLVTTPPAPWSTVDQSFCAQMVAAGALDWAAPQYYDGPNLATQAYIVPSVDTWAKLLGADKLVVGFGISTAANYMTVGQVISTWNAVSTNHPDLRGAFDWEIDVDQASGWPFADQVGPLIDP